MSLLAICQRCGETKSAWTIRAAHISIGELCDWKLQLCELCTAQAQMIIRAALVSPQACDAVDPVGVDAVADQRPRATESNDSSQG